MIEIRDTEYIRTKEVDGTVISCVRAEIDCDTADDLPAVDCIQGCELIAGSIAWDISTGDFYGLGSDGTWKKQNGGGGSGTVEYFEVDINCNAQTGEYEISNTYDEIKAALDSGKIISGESTVILDSYYISAVRGGFNDSLFDGNGCIVLGADPFEFEEGLVLASYVITSDDNVYVGFAEYRQLPNNRSKSGNKIDLSNTPFAKFINSIKEEEKK